MKPTITLTKQESVLRQLLLDTSTFVSSELNVKQPELRFTGGWVRDKLLGIGSKDIDIAVSTTTGYQFATCMEKFLTTSKDYEPDVMRNLGKIKANPEQSKHLETATTKIFGLEIDLVNLRKEVYADNSRNPTVEFGTPEEDALRRDATVNALFYNLSTMKIEDFTGKGLDDMRLKIIRTPLAPFQTFKDDPLRILRCIRFASKLGYEIDADAQKCMSNTEIQDALRQKIRRERVGVEVEKMLAGPNPHQALHLIDKSALYRTIFIAPHLQQPDDLDVKNWHKAYDLLIRMTVDTREGPLLELKSALNLDNSSTSKTELYFAWLLCALVPWKKFEGGDTNASEKASTPLVASVVRESLKADNKTVAVVREAALYMNEVVAYRDAILSSRESPSPGKRKLETLTREALGMSIRRWGSHWRSTVLFAILVECSETSNADDLSQLLDQYVALLDKVQKFNLTDAYAIKSLVNGRQIMKAVGKPGGPWLANALDFAMAWQLRNPETTTTDEVIAEIVQQFGQQEAG